MIQPTNLQNPYPQQGGANAVSINIFNPQAYASAPSGQQNQAPWGYTNQIYEMPQVSAYAPQAQGAFIPYYQPQVMPQPQNVVAPMPQEIPQSVMVQAPQVQQTAEPANEQQNTALDQPQAQEAQEVQETQEAPQEPVQVAPTINTDELVQGLRSADNQTKAQAINQIAQYVQESPEVALQVVSEPIMQALVDVINEDTTNLEGPSEQQIAVAQKIENNEQLTPEEEEIAKQYSPRDAANRNRIFALYTLAMIQKLQRDELNQYIESQKANGEQAIEPLKAEDLIGYNDMVNIIKNDPRPEVKVAAIQALQHIAEPQDKESLQNALSEALNSQDETIKAAANDAMAKIAA